MMRTRTPNRRNVMASDKPLGPAPAMRTSRLRSVCLFRVRLVDWPGRRLQPWQDRVSTRRQAARMAQAATPCASSGVKPHVSTSQRHNVGVQKAAIANAPRRRCAGVSPGKLRADGLDPGTVPPFAIVDPLAIPRSVCSSGYATASRAPRSGERAGSGARSVRPAAAAVGPARGGA